MRLRRNYQAILGSLLALLLTSSVQAKPCLTKSEARKLYKTDRIYSHTTAHCWDDQAWDFKSENETNMMVAADKTALAAVVKPHVETALPSLVKADGVWLAQWTGSLYVDWFSPWSMLTYPWIWDFDAPDAFTPAQTR